MSLNYDVKPPYLVTSETWCKVTSQIDLQRHPGPSPPLQLGYQQYQKEDLTFLDGLSPGWQRKKIPKNPNPSESRPLPRVLEEPQPPHNLHAIGAAWKRMVRRVCEGPPARSYITDEGTSQITMSCVNPPLILLVLDGSWVNCFICLFFQSEKTNCNCVTCSMDFSMKPSLAWSRGEI